MTGYMDRFDSLYLPKLGIRAPTFRAVIREALCMGVRSIVETGCIRKPDNWSGDGQSTVIWEDYVSQYSDSRFTTIDINQAAIDTARECCPEATCIVSDSVTELAKPGPNIDPLYLDSFDLDMSNPEPAAMHCLFEFCAARPRLSKGSIVFIDDSPMGPDGVGGKGVYVAKWFEQIGIVPFTWGYQVAWILP